MYVIFFQVKSREVLVFITCIEWEREREKEKKRKKRTKCHRPFQGLRLNGISHPASSFLSSVCSLHRNTDHDPNTRRARVRRGGGYTYTDALTSRDITLMWISLYYRVVARRESRWKTFSVWTTDLPFDENLPWNVCKDDAMRCIATRVTDEVLVHSLYYTWIIV